MCAARIAFAQGGAYVPLDDPAVPTIDALVARGALARLASLERPYRAADVRDAIDSALASAQRGASLVAPRAWYEAARVAVVRYAGASSRDDVVVQASLTPFLTAQTSAGRELMLADTVDGLHPGLHVRLAGTFGNVSAVTRLRGDRALRDDPEYLGKKDRAVVARIEDAYVSARWRYVALDAGRMARNWGPPLLDGLQIGHYADSYDHLQLALGVEALHLTTIVARLDDMTLANASFDTTIAQRYMTAHRLTARWRGLEGAVAEQVVYGGPGRGFEPSLANPVSLLDLSQYSEGELLNVSYALDLAVRTGGRGFYAVQAMLDDFQVDDCGPQCEEPASWGFTATAEAMPLPLPLHATGFAAYTRVTNLVYRTTSPWERVTFRDLSLGRGRADYDEARAGVELAPPLGGPLRLYGALRRQGEGDYRLPFPPPAANSQAPAIFAGTVTRVARVGAQWSLTGRLEGTADIGWQRVTNDRHQPGVTRSGFEGRVVVRIPLGISARVSTDGWSRVH